MLKNEPFRAEHIGSLLRPAELREARRAFEEGALCDEKLRQVEDRAIETAVAGEDLPEQRDLCPETLPASCWLRKGRKVYAPAQYRESR